MSLPTPYAGSLSPTEADLDSLITVLLERETPLSTLDLARLLLEQRVQAAAEALAARYRDVVAYNPSSAYQAGQKLVFPAQAYATGTVTALREGNNPSYGSYRVITVTFDDATTAEYAAELTTEHALSGQDAATTGAPALATASVDDLLAQHGPDITAELDAALTARADLVRLAGKWFPAELMMDVNVGHLNLADAVLELAEGGPLSTVDILDQIGGLGSAPLELQEFSLNYALNTDERFDEVGPAGEVLWFLKRAEPIEVREKPAFLRYTPVEYDERLVGDDGWAIEAEIDDELSALPLQPVTSATVRLIYPHRRAGTLPLNSQTRAVFPTARAPRVIITLVDGQDGQTFNGWVVHNEGYVFGLADFYKKHRLPLGSLLNVRRGDAPGHIVVDFAGHRARTEYVPVLSVKDNQPSFELVTRPIGVPFDDLMLLGIDELGPVEALANSLAQSRRPLAGVVKVILPALTRLSPQGVAHFKTIYAAVNVLRRTPPAALMAALNGSADFDNPAGHYWKLSDA